MKSGGPNQSDRDQPEVLARRARAGDGAAFGELAELMSGRLYNFLLRRTRNRSQAEELTQEALVRAWERIDRYDDAWRFSTWLFTIATRLAIGEDRRRVRQRTGSWGDRVEADPASCREPRPGAGEAGGSPLWRLAATHLTDEQHTALWLRYAEDLSIGEIGQVLGKSDVAVRVCLYRARRVLGQRAVEEGLIEPEEAREGPEHPPGHARSRLAPAGGVAGACGGTVWRIAGAAGVSGATG